MSCTTSLLVPPPLRPPRPAGWRRGAWTLALLGLLLLARPAPAQGLGYYWQSVTGHLAVLGAARPVQEWLDDARTPEPLRQRLALALRIRRFAVTELQLPDNASYSRYAALDRPAVVWNVVAAPPDALSLQTWCFPVVGCAGYKGYYAQDQARQEADRLQAQGLEVAVYGVPAYSTLGWMNWAGGDPLLSTFIRYPEGELARMLFHELAHQVVYARDDTAFNESFATTVERLGAQAWLDQQADPQARQVYAELDARRSQFRALTLATRQALEALYRQPPGGAALAPRKAELLDQFRQRYQALKADWGGYAGYDAWVAGANNASFAALTAYDEWVPGFEALFAREGRDWRRFYDAVRALAHQSPAERRAVLQP